METLKLVDIVKPEAATKWAQKLHHKKDDIDVIRKGYVASVSEDGIKPGERAIVARVSTDDRDRDGEIIEAKGIDFSAYYPGNAVLCWAHKYDIPTIGRAQWVKLDDHGLVCKFEFADTQFADEIYRLYKGKFLNAFSIGFIPLDYDTKEKVHRKISLLEVSAVPVPANQSALVMEAYHKGLITCEALKADMGIEAETKMADMDHNPSVDDIRHAIDEALMRPPKDMGGDGMKTGEVAAALSEMPFRMCIDLYPVDYPNGHCTCMEIMPEKSMSTMFQQDYEYEDGKAEMMGEMVEVMATWSEKKNATLVSNPLEIEGIENRKDATPAPPPLDFAALMARLDELARKVDALTLPPPLAPAPAPGSEDVIDLDPEDVCNIEVSPEIIIEATPVPVAKSVQRLPKLLTEDNIAQAVTEAVAKLDIAEILREGISISLDKLRGIVR